MRIPFLVGDGKAYYVDVWYWAEFPRDEQGRCAFCLGDPCPKPPEDILHATHIQLYMLSKRDKFETCPVCLGRAS